MKLSHLLRVLPEKKIFRLKEKEIKLVAFDSRKVAPQSLFVCITGLKADGHRFARQAISLGAEAVIAEKKVSVPSHIPLILVPDTRFALSALCDKYFASPSKKLYCVAITGTNGKSTTTYILFQLLRAAGIPACMFSTVFTQIGHETFSLPLTTSDPWTLHHLLAKAVTLKRKVAIIEVSSHAIALKRTAHVSWQSAGITNITQDHLDFHHSMESYAAVKISLFESLKRKKISAVAANRDDPTQQEQKKRFPKQTIWYGLHPKASVRAENIRISSRGWQARLITPARSFSVKCPLIGRFQIHNLLCALSLAQPFQISPAKLQKAIATLSPVPGRMEPVRQRQPFSVIVDYAHTPDALSKALETTREWTKGKIICVFGCGGDRDRAKRPLMARAVAKHADQIIVTSDNPRSEDPNRILKDIVKGIPKKTHFLVEPDRQKAIAKAIRKAQPQDTLVIAGKGHETYQILKDKIIHFDDRECAAKLLAKRKLKNSKEKRTHPALSLSYKRKSLCLTPAQIVQWIDVQPKQGAASFFSSISIDTRTLQPGALFIALRGERFDGHRFIPEAIRKGCAGILTEKPVRTPEGIWVFPVSDTRKALGDLARAYLKTVPTKVIAITGSTGKSTTKELIFTLLKATHSTTRSQASFNNEIGLPLTVLSLLQEQYLVQEMAMRKLGDITYLTSIAPPSYGVITRIGTAHLGITGSLTQTIRGKGELIQGLQRDGILFLNAEDPNSHSYFSSYPNIVSFGLSPQADFYLRNLSMILEKGWQADLYHRKRKVQSLFIPLLGKDSLTNVSAALSIATKLKVPPATFQEALHTFHTLEGRLQLIIKKPKHPKILFDAYNANLESMQQALWTLAYQTRGERKIAVLGTMKELGKKSQFYHTKIGRICGSLPIHMLVAIGEYASAMVKGFASTSQSTKARSYTTPKRAIGYLKKTCTSQDVVLLKASRALALETVKEALLS